MKQRVKIGAGSIVLTVFSIALFIPFMFFNNPPLPVQILLGAVVVGIALSGLYYMPISICADSSSIRINRCLKTTTIPMADVKSVKMHTPSKGTIRLCGSGGFMGFWGWFCEKETGRYFAYCGRPKECFLVELHSGRKYLLGCNNPQLMVEYIRARMRKM
jgi:hypothetical protein